MIEAAILYSALMLLVFSMLGVMGLVFVVGWTWQRIGTNGLILVLLVTLYVAWWLT